MASRTVVEYALQLKAEGAGAITVAAKEAEAAAKAQRDAAKAADEKARADAEAATEAARAAEEEREQAEALERQRQAMEQLDPVMRGLVEQYKQARKAAEEQAEALGLSAGEVQALRRASEQGAQSADEWAASLKRGEKGAEGFGASISKAGEHSAKLRGALSLVSPQLGEVAGLANDAFDAMEVGVGALGSLNPLMLGLAAAGAAAAAAYVTWNREQEEAKALLAIQQRETSELTTRIRDLEDALLDAEVASGRLKDAEAERIGIDQRAQRAMEDAAASKDAEIFAAEKTIRANEGIAGALQSVSGAQLGVLSTMAATIDVVGGFTSRTDAAKQTVDTLTASLDRQTKVIGEQADAEQEAAAAREKKRQEDEAERKAQEEKRKAAERAREAEREAAEEERERAEEAKKLEAEIRENLAKRAEERKQTETVMLMAAEAEMQAARDQHALEQQLAEERARKQRETLESAAAAVEGALSGPQGGLNALASAGPLGAIIAGIAEAAQDFEGTLQGFHDTHMSITKGIASIPDVLGENLGTWLVEGTNGVTDMVVGFIENLASNIDDILIHLIGSLPDVAGKFIQAIILDIPKAAVAFVLTLADPNTWIDVVEAFVQGIREAVADMIPIFRKADEDVKNAPDAVASWWNRTKENVSDFVGSFATGTDFVPRTGLALVHQGERIVPATGAGSGTTSAMMGGRGGGVTVNVGGGLLYGSPTDLAREVGRAAERGVVWGSGG